MDTQHLVSEYFILKLRAFFMVAPLRETGNECNNEKGRYERSSEIEILTGYYISCKDNENMYKLASL